MEPSIERVEFAILTKNYLDRTEVSLPRLY